MRFIVEYEDEVYEVSLTDGIEILEYKDILSDRVVLDCWLLDRETKMWMSIPRIAILRILVSELNQTDAYQLRFKKY